MNIKFTEEHEAMLRDNESRISELEAYKLQCDDLHKIGKEHRKRVDDAMDNLTNSNILLAKAITDMNITLSRIADTVDEDRPTIKIIKDVGTAWDINKQLFFGLVAAAAGMVALISAWRALT